MYNFQKGDYDIKQFDKIIGQLDLYQEINAIRSKLQTKMPRPNLGTLVADFIGAIPRYGRRQLTIAYK